VREVKEDSLRGLWVEHGGYVKGDEVLADIRGQLGATGAPPARCDLALISTTIVILNIPIITLHCTILNIDRASIAAHVITPPELRVVV